VPGLVLSRRLVAWNVRDTPDSDVLELLANAGTDQAAAGVFDRGGTLSVSGGLQSICEVREGPATISCLELSAPMARAVDFGRMHLRITWDDRSHASVDAPLDLLSRPATLHNPDGREWLVKALRWRSVSPPAGSAQLPVPDAVLPRGEDRTRMSRADRADRRRQVGGERRAVRRGVEPRRLFPRDVSRPRRPAVRRGPGVSRYA